MPVSDAPPLPETDPMLTPGSRTVSLVDASNRVTGEMEVGAAHTAPGFAHLACSAVVFGPNDTVLMQRRADHKPTFGGLWSNTCCTHPLRDEEPLTAAQRRVFEELGIRVTLRPAGVFRYRSVDQTTGFVEHELDTVGIAELDTLVATTLDPSEVAEAEWMSLIEVETRATRGTLTPWCAMVMQLALSARNA